MRGTIAKVILIVDRRWHRDLICGQASKDIIDEVNKTSFLALQVVGDFRMLMVTRLLPNKDF